MKIRDSRTGSQVVIHKHLSPLRKKAVFEALGLLEVWKNRKSREAFWSWYCTAPIDEIFIRTGYEVRVAFGCVLVPPHEYKQTVPLRRGDE